MTLSKNLAMALFHLSASVFTALSVYGIFLYLDGSAPVRESTLASLLYGAGIAASIAGICFFGTMWDRRKAEESRKPPSPGKPPTGVKR